MSRFCYLILPCWLFAYLFHSLLQGLINVQQPMQAGQSQYISYLLGNTGYQHLAILFLQLLIQPHQNAQEQTICPLQATQVHDNALGRRGLQGCEQIGQWLSRAHLYVRGPQKFHHNYRTGFFYLE